MSSTDILSKWTDGSVDADELVNLFAFYFGSARRDEDGWIRYPSDGPAAMRANARSDGTVHLERRPALTSASLRNLERKIETDLVVSTGPSPVTSVMFTSRSVEGHYQAPRAAFRIGPVPPAAPRPAWVVADHPFVFETSVPGSADWLVTSYRASRSAQRWAWVLNALLTEGIRLPSNGYRWILSGADDAPLAEERIQYLPEMYWFSGLGQPNPVLPEGGAEMSRTTTAQYYARLGRDSSPLDLPASLDSSIASYLALTDVHQRRFLQAAQWFAAAGDMAASHRSSMVVALVAAIETLAFEASPATPCRHCGHDTSTRPTRRFKDFLAQMAPGFPRAVADRLYEMRSRLVHGLGTLLQDEPLAMPFKSALLDEQQQTYLLSAVVRTSMVNWLSVVAGQSWAP